MSELNQTAGKMEPVVKDIQTVLSVSYIVAVGIGMLFNAKKFSAFGINIFEYADVLDFLVAPFGDVVILLFTFISVFVAYSVLKLDLYWERKFPNSYERLSLGMHKKNWYGIARYLSAAFIFVFYLYISALTYAKIERRNLNKQHESKLTFTDNETVTGIIIGKTKDVLFLLNGEHVRAIPIEALKEFEVR